MRYWVCPHGHVTKSEKKPDVCRKCKEIDTDLWLTSFKEIKKQPWVKGGANAD